jgi:hypothetical protein
VAWNAFAQEIDGHWRIPIEGLTKGAGNGKLSETPEIETAAREAIPRSNASG